MCSGVLSWGHIFIMKIKELFQQYGVFFAWVISIVATLSSLYFSEFLHYPPCTLCWYQRVCMYPLFFILGIATYREDNKVLLYTAPLAILGACISFVQTIQMQFPALRNIGLCHEDVSCYINYLQLFGVIPIPLLSFISFSIIYLLLWVAYTEKPSVA